MERFCKMKKIEYKQVCWYHKNYLGKNEPTRTCTACWIVYLRENSNIKLDADVVQNLLMKHWPISFGYVKKRKNSK